MPSDLPNFVRSLFPQASPELRALHQSVIDNAALLAVDFLSIQDLLAVAGYADDENLHVLLLLMFLALEEGSLCVEFTQAGLAGRLADLAGEEQAGYWTPRLLASLQQPFLRLIGPEPGDARPLLFFAKGDRRYLYFHKFLRSEMVLRDELLKRLREPPGFGVPHPGALGTSIEPPGFGVPHPGALGTSIEAPGFGVPHPGALGTSIEPPGFGVPHPGALGASFDWQPILREVLRERPLQLAGRPLQLDPDQLQALEKSLQSNFVVISGGPGTGKTSIVLTLLRCLVRGGTLPDHISLAAPTGRAAQRLTDSLRSGLEKIAPGPAESDLALHHLQAGTLHHLLEYSPTRGYFRRHAENPLPADAVIVDEVSMVGVVLMAQLMRALRPDCKLVLLGDKDQLPSVEAGAVLASLVPSRNSTELRSPALPARHVALLQTNHRSQPEIQAAAQAVNRQDASIADRLPALTLPGEDRQSAWWKAIERQGGCWLVEPTSGVGAQAAEFRGILQRWAGHHFLEEYPERIRECLLRPGGEDDPVVVGQVRRLFRMLEGSRILTLVREGAWGSVGINQYLDGFLRPNLDRGSRGRLFAGAPVLITANDHVRQLYNGDVGLVLKCKSSLSGEESLRALFPRKEGFLSFAVESLPSHELGLALTVHKSQGSEYDSVLLVLPPSGARRLLTKEILYTGVTRARNLALIAGSRDTLRLAVRRRIARDSALMDLGEP